VTFRRARIRLEGAPGGFVLIDAERLMDALGLK